MNNQILVSVIIPVFNAEQYIEKAVQSALFHNEVGEIILIEDGSQDNSLEICKKIALNNDSIKLLRHENKENNGPGISRNIGIQHAKGKYISFLDADDYYLSNRFDLCIDILNNNQNIDGVYEVIGVDYYSDKAKSKFIKRMTHVKNNIKLKKLPIDYTGIENIVSSNNLFFHLLKTDIGWIHLDGLTIRSDSLVGLILFNNNYLGQDSEFILRLANEKTLVGSNSLKKVANRGIHDGNRVLLRTNKLKNKIQIDWNYWLRYSIDKKLSNKILKFLVMRVTDDKNRLKKIKNLFQFIFNHPKLIRIFFP